jgi:hypothetical protein
MSLPGRFAIFVGGRPVVRPEGQGDEEEYFQARAGGPNSGPPPAVFEVQPFDEGLQLVSGEYALGRYRIEDLSLMPKRVGWCKRNQAHMLQPVQIRQGGSGPELSFSGMSRSSNIGNVSNVLSQVLSWQSSTTCFIPLSWITVCNSHA